MNRCRTSGCNCRVLCRPRRRGGSVTMQPLNRLQIAWRAAQDIGDGMLVNLGMGMPVQRGRLSAPRRRCLHPVGEWRDRRRPARPARPRRHRSGRRQQPAHHAPAWRGDRRFVLVVCHDPRRPHRRSDPGRIRGCGQRRSRQLGHAPAKQRTAGRRRHGFGGMRALGLGDHGSRHAQGRAATARKVHAAAHRRALRQTRLHGSRRHRRHARAAWWCARCSRASARPNCAAAPAHR